MLNPTRRYTGSGLIPCKDVPFALTDNVPLPPGFQGLAGTVLGQQEATGASANEVQTLTAAGAIEGGVFALVAADGAVSTKIPWNATAAQAQQALESVYGAGNVIASGGPFPGAVLTVTFQGMLAAMPQPLLKVISGLTGAGAGVTIARTTAGQSPTGYFGLYNAANVDGTETARCVLQFDTVVDPFGKVTFGQQGSGDDNGCKDYQAPAWFRGIFKTSELIGLDEPAISQLGRLLVGNASQLNLPTTQLLIG